MRWQSPKVQGPLVLFLALLPLGLMAWARTAPEAWIPAAVGSESLPIAGEGSEPFDSVVRGAASVAPFRMTRVASGVAYDPLRADPDLRVPVVGPPRPALLLSGFVLGSRPGAVVEGIPGREAGVLLFEGDTLAGFKVVRIANDRVVITGSDTTWTLSVRRPW
jgi:hypothetical protein